MVGTLTGATLTRPTPTNTMSETLPVTQRRDRAAGEFYRVSKIDVPRPHSKPDNQIMLRLLNRRRPKVRVPQAATWLVVLAALQCRHARTHPQARQ